MNITVLGSGAWGTAIAQLLADNGHNIKLWCREIEVATQIQQKKINEQFLPGVILSSMIEPTTDLQYALSDSSYVFLAIPVKFLRSILEQSKEFVSKKQVFIILSKGIEQNTLMLPSQMIDDVLGYQSKKAALMGPSFAKDLSQRQMTAVALAAQDCLTAQSLQKIIATPYFHPFISLDIMGVQACAALKNVIALAIGILEGAGMGDNVKSYIITRGLKEMAQIVMALGGKQETVFGLAGVGDLILTTTGKSSKNLLFGKELGKGFSFNELCTQWPTLPEGINSAQSVRSIIEKHSLEMPICTGVYAIIFQNESIDSFMSQIMARSLERECL
jgi:glycerol-3-phosphate dehydrogenase (NAD(P)+)